jgi:hypothetical protein
MEAFIKSFPFQLLFRGVFPGCFFVISFLSGTEGTSNLEKVITADYKKWMVVAIFMGVLIYVLHRAIMYPIIECLLECLYPTSTDKTSTEKNRNWSGVTRLIRSASIDRLGKMWSFGEYEDPKANIAAHLRTWNDYVQFQYTSALSIIVGAVCVQFFVANTCLPLCWPLIIAAVILAFGGLVSEIRLRAVGNELIIKEVSKENQPR